MNNSYRTFDSFELFCNFMYNRYFQEKHEWNETDIKDRDTYLLENSTFLTEKYKSRAFEG